MTTRAPDTTIVLRFESAAAWEAWLATHHAAHPGLWVEMAKKATGVPSVNYAEALEVALCYGWIDGQKNPAGPHFWRQRFTPRRARSKWSKINRAKVEALIATGRMQPAGLREVESAKRDGRWDAAYDSPSNVTVHEDLARALEGNAKASAFFATLDRTNRYAILYRVHDAKKPETRARRISEFVAMLARGDTLHPPRNARVQSAAKKSAGAVATTATVKKPSKSAVAKEEGAAAPARKTAAKKRAGAAAKPAVTTKRTTTAKKSASTQNGTARSVTARKR